MAKQLCNACVLQNWSFGSREEAEAWLQKHMVFGVEEVLYSGSLCGDGWFLTVTRRYNSAPLTVSGQIATIGALIAGCEFDHAAAPEVQ